MTKIIEDFRIRLEKALTEKNMKPIELAEKTGISQSTISQYRSGYSKPKDKRNVHTNSHEKIPRSGSLQPGAYIHVDGILAAARGLSV